MFDFHQKRKMRTVFTSRITQGILLILSFMVMWSAYDRYLIARDTADQRSAEESEVLDLEERRTTLGAEVEYLSTERGIEAEMRRQFDIARDGEQVVIILEDDDLEENIESSATNATSARAWYKFW
jgi:cell division protein FtsB